MRPTRFMHTLSFMKWGSMLAYFQVSKQSRQNSDRPSGFLWLMTSQNLFLEQTYKGSKLDDTPTFGLKHLNN